MQRRLWGGLDFACHLAAAAGGPLLITTGTRVWTLNPSDNNRRHGRPAKRRRDDLDKYRSDTIWQRTAHDRLTWRRHADAYSGSSHLEFLFADKLVEGLQVEHRPPIAVFLANQEYSTVKSQESDARSSSSIALLSSKDIIS